MLFLTKVVLPGIELIEFWITDILLFICILYFGINENKKNGKIINFEKWLGNQCY